LGFGLWALGFGLWALGFTLDIVLFLPDGFSVQATGIVIWDDKHGKSGLNFQCKTPEMRTNWIPGSISLFATSAQEAHGGNPLF
jgi:hypothetical protein